MRAKPVVRSRKTVTCRGTDFLGFIELVDQATGTILGDYPLSPSYYPNTQMLKDSALYSKFYFRKAHLKISSAAPSTCAGKYGVGYLADPEQQLLGSPAAIIATMTALPGYVDVPITGYNDTVCIAKLETMTEKDMLYTEPHAGQSLRWSQQGTFPVVATNAMSGFTGTTTLSVYLEYEIEYAQPISKNVQSYNVILPDGNYYVDSGGRLTTSTGGQNLPPEVISQFTRNGYYVIAPPLPAGLFSSGPAVGYAYLGSNGYVYPVASKSAAQSQSGYTSGADKAVAVVGVEFVWQQPPTFRVDSLRVRREGDSYLLQERAKRALQWLGGLSHGAAAKILGEHMTGDVPGGP
jgi:hypothetical protein